MNKLTIDNKSYVIIPQKEYDQLLIMAARKTTPVNKVTLRREKKMAYKIIDELAKRK